MTTDSSTPQNGHPSIDTDPLEEATRRGRDFNRRLIETSKAAGTTTVDAYEKAAKGWADAEEKLAGTTSVEWLSDLTMTHAGFVRDMSTAMAHAARSLIA